MLFNSFTFALFLPVVFALFWVIPKQKIAIRNVCLLAASLFFYGWWDWRFLGLILGSAFLDFFLGKEIYQSNSKSTKRIFFVASLVANIGALVFFKYCNFFIDNFIELSESIGLNSNVHSLNILLPVGISFYTFQTLSYTIDIYRGRLEPTSNLLSFLTFVSFFPQLVAGPIERASHLLPQFFTAKVFKYKQAVQGLRYMLWGFFMKMVIADNCAIAVNEVFSSYENMSGVSLLLGAVFFAFQIYGDFAGYSYIAIGVAKLFGFELMVNFRYPYLSKSISDFWKRWHISLSTWFRDYVYIPLGGNRVGLYKHFRNLLITFLVSGIWHGANWTFFVWGLLHWSYYVMEYAGTTAINKVSKGFFSRFFDLSKWAVTMVLVVFSWIYFRSESLQDANQYITSIFSHSFFGYVQDSGMARIISWKALILGIGLLLVLEFVQRGKEFVLDIENKKGLVRYCTYSIVGLSILYFGRFNNSEFIYFQF